MKEGTELVRARSEFKRNDLLLQPKTSAVPWRRASAHQLCGELTCSVGAFSLMITLFIRLCEWSEEETEDVRKSGAASHNDRKLGRRELGPYFCCVCSVLCVPQIMTITPELVPQGYSSLQDSSGMSTVGNKCQVRSSRDSSQPGRWTPKDGNFRNGRHYPRRSSPQIRKAQRSAITSNDTQISTYRTSPVSPPEDIEDCSKGDALSKVIAILQTS